MKSDQQLKSSHILLIQRSHVSYVHFELIDSLLSAARYALIRYIIHQTLQNVQNAIEVFNKLIKVGK